MLLVCCAVQKAMFSGMCSSVSSIVMHCWLYYHLIGRCQACLAICVDLHCLICTSSCHPDIAVFARSSQGSAVPPSQQHARRRISRSPKVVPIPMGSTRKQLQPSLGRYLGPGEHTVFVLVCIVHRQLSLRNMEIWLSQCAVCCQHRGPGAKLNCS